MTATETTVRPMTGEQRILAAAGRQPVDATPVWYMRQAGRCLMDYRDLRKKYDILTMQRNPELATEVTLMPVRRFGVDAAVLYSDIMIPLEGMGVPFRIEPEIGPIIDAPLRTEADVERLRVLDAEEAVPYVFEAIRLIRRELDGKTAVVGFAGSPFTLACYMLEGRPSRDYGKAKAFMYGRPELWHKLMATITEVTVRYLRAQVRAGAQLIQLFDSWVGMLGPEVYEEFVLPYSTRIFSEIRATNTPTIHFGTGAAGLLELLAQAGPDMVSVDWRMPLDRAWERIGPAKGIQGNLDPTVLLAPWEAVERRAGDVLRRAGGRPGHIFNLGHGVLPDTDPDQLARLAEWVHTRTSHE
jgi:uroporphyrinogen decarboxylase